MPQAAKDPRASWAHLVTMVLQVTLDPSVNVVNRDQTANAVPRVLREFEVRLEKQVKWVRWDHLATTVIPVRLVSKDPLAHLVHPDHLAQS